MKKPRKEIYKKYRGVGILKDSSYTDNDLFNNSKSLRSLRVMLMTPDIERYFNTIGQARAYVDANFQEIKDEEKRSWEVFEADIKEEECQEENVNPLSQIIYDDIPF